MHPPPNHMAHHSTTLYQTITNTLSKTTSRSVSSSPSSNASQSSQRSPPNALRRLSSRSSTSSSHAKPSALPRNLVFDFVRDDEVRAAHALEVQSYPPEDAASYEKLLARQKSAPHLFLGAFIPMPPPKVAGPLSVSGTPRRKLIGFVCSTAASALTLRSMSHHDASDDAHMVCIHSVVVASEYRHKGLATRMLENYVSRLKKAEEGKGPDAENGKRGYEILALLAHEELTSLYNKVGFRVQCHSHIQYGSGSWLEMRRNLSAPMPRGLKVDTFLSRSSSNESSSDVMMSSPVAMAETSPVCAPNSSVPARQSSLSDPDDDPTPKATSNPVAQVEQTTSEASTATPQQTTLSSTNSLPAQSPPGMPSQASILAALRAQSQPGKNPGTSFTSILGQAIAAKTFAEDAGMALEARLVNRQDGTNLAKLYCPMENCRCCILGKEAGEWTRKESGPLSSPLLQLPNSPTPPQGPAFPMQTSHSGSGNRLLTTVKGFWIVDGPLQFDNIGFSRDMKWTAPLPQGAQSPQLANAADSSPNSLSSSIELGSPKSRAAQEKEAKEYFKRQEKDRQREEKQKRKEAKARDKQQRARDKKGGSGSDSYASDDDVSQLLAHLSLGVAAGEEVTVKYLVCPDCECGPLGFTILPPEMQGGRLAAAVGDQVDRMKGGTLDPNNTLPVVKPKPQPFYLAADRVRYLFERSG